MENGHLHDDKLFRAVHDRLSDYEAPADGADWDAMSRSLDNLPKTARYKWKVSLNTILVIVGLVGISALSFALVTKSGATSETKADPQHTVNTQPANTNPVVPVNNTQPSTQNSFASSNDLGLATTNSAMNTENNNSSVTKTDASATNVAMNPDGSVKKRKKNQLLFGDQIDPKKGFIYNTKENPNNIVPPVDPAPDVFYDYTDNGQLKKIEIKKDSTSRGSNKPKADSTAKIFTPGVPTEGGQTGFDTE